MIFGLPSWVVGLIVLLVVLAILAVIISMLGTETLELALELID